MERAATINRVIKHERAMLDAGTRRDAEDRRMATFTALDTQSVAIEQTMNRLNHLLILVEGAETAAGKLSELNLNRLKTN